METVALKLGFAFGIIGLWALAYHFKSLKLLGLTVVVLSAALAIQNL